MLLVMDPTVHKFRQLQTELQQFHNRSNFHFGRFELRLYEE